MIRKLTEQDRENTLNFLAEEPAINLFIIGDIEAFGFDSEFQELWGQYNSDNSLEGVLLRYNESFIPYWKHDEFDTSEFKKIINSYNEELILSGKEEVINKLNDILPDYKRSKMFFCELKDKLNLKFGTSEIVRAEKKHCKAVSEFINEIDEFAGLSSKPERLEHVLETKTGKIYFMENSENQIISVSQTVAENSKSAMVVGVATKKSERGKGYMTECLSKLCSDTLDEGKTLCLFYDNPKAGSVYHKLGFESIDNWVMAKKDKVK